LVSFRTYEAVASETPALCATCFKVTLGSDFAAALGIGVQLRTSGGVWVGFVGAARAFARTFGQKSQFGETLHKHTQPLTLAE
jgi:hypothetical protein